MINSCNGHDKNYVHPIKFNIYTIHLVIKYMYVRIRTGDNVWMRDSQCLV